jgi:hypothetical protein
MKQCCYCGDFTNRVESFFNGQEIDTRHICEECYEMELEYHKLLIVEEDYQQGEL